MPKLKTKRAAAKRFRLTGRGKVRRKQAGKSHLLTKKTSKRKRGLRRLTLSAGANARHIKVMIGAR